MQYRLKNPDMALSPLNAEDSAWLSENFPELERDYDRECPTCGKNNGIGRNGSVIIGGTVYECYCRMQVNLQAHFLAANIGARFHRLGGDDWGGDAEAAERCKKFVEDLRVHAMDGNGLYIWGNTGTGKTMLASIIAKEAVKRGYSTYFTTSAGYINLVKAGWHDTHMRDYIVGKTERSKLLVLDDFGAEQDDGSPNGSQNVFARKTIENLIRTRSQMQKMTVITSNLDPAPLRMSWGPRFASMLSECTDFVHVGGSDYRRMLGDSDGERRFIS